MYDPYVGAYGVSRNMLRSTPIQLTRPYRRHLLRMLWMIFPMLTGKSPYHSCQSSPSLLFHAGTIHRIHPAFHPKGPSPPSATLLQGLTAANQDGTCFPSIHARLVRYGNEHATGRERDWDDAGQPDDALWEGRRHGIWGEFGLGSEFG
jgi:hypothetical protein